MRYLSKAEYESVLQVGLQRIGIAEPDAARLIAARWPMDAVGLVGEAHGRGLVVTLDGIADWLYDLVGYTWDDGSPVVPESVLFTSKLADQCFEWLVETGRATSTLVGELLTADQKPLDAVLAVSKRGCN